MPSKIVLIRHGETDWSKSGRHTGTTDLPLTIAGETAATELAMRLRQFEFTTVYTSPRLRARRTCELAGLSHSARVDDDLAEWNYGDYEGKTSAEIHALKPDWVIFNDGAPGGESPAQITARADRAIVRLRNASGVTAVFSHGHFLRTLAARWADLPITCAQRLLLGTSSISILDYNHNDPAQPSIALWNSQTELPP